MFGEKEKQKIPDKPKCTMAQNQEHRDTTGLIYHH